MEIQKSTRPLPKIDELYSDILETSKFNDLNRLLNRPPKPEWIREHPFARGVKYIPIGTVEYLLTMIFVRWKVEVRGIQTIANSIVVHIRLWVLDPITSEWEYQDGIGAAPIKTAKGAAATDFSQVLDSAVMTGAPAAESYAIKDAAEKFGTLFGKDLNRKEFMPYLNLDGKLDPSQIMADNTFNVELCKTVRKTSLGPVEKEDLLGQLEFPITLERAQSLEKYLQGFILTDRDKIRSGVTVSASEAQSAVKQAVNDPNA